MAYWQENPPTHVLVAAYLIGGGRQTKRAVQKGNQFTELSQAVAMVGGSSTKKLPEIYRTQ